MASQDRRHELPRKVIVGQNTTETVVHVALKFLAFVIFYRERLQLETSLPDDSIPFVPDLVQLDYELRPVLWVECGECTLSKLNKLSVKAPCAEIWIVKRCAEDAYQLKERMEKEELRTGRYGIIGLDREMFEEIAGMIQPRNEFTWVQGGFDPPQLQFDFNGLWFDTPFTLLRH